VARGNAAKRGLFRLKASSSPEQLVAGALGLWQANAAIAQRKLRRDRRWPVRGVSDGHRPCDTPGCGSRPEPQGLTPGGGATCSGTSDCSPYSVAPDLTRAKGAQHASIYKPCHTPPDAKAAWNVSRQESPNAQRQLGRKGNQFQVTWASSLSQARLTATRNLREAPDPSVTRPASPWRRRRKEHSAAPSNQPPSTKVNITMVAKNRPYLQKERHDGRLRSKRSSYLHGLLQRAGRAAATEFAVAIRCGKP